MSRAIPSLHRWSKQGGTETCSEVSQWGGAPKCLATPMLSMLSLFHPAFSCHHSLRFPVYCTSFDKSLKIDSTTLASGLVFERALLFSSSHVENELLFPGLLPFFLKNPLITTELDLSPCRSNLPTWPWQPPMRETFLIAFGKSKQMMLTDFFCLLCFAHNFCK